MLPGPFWAYPGLGGDCDIALQPTSCLSWQHDSTCNASRLGTCHQAPCQEAALWAHLKRLPAVLPDLWD